MSRLSLAFAAAALALLTACASGEASDPGGPPPGAPPGGGRADAGRCPPLFISPAGEPFRAEPGAAVCPLQAWFAKADANGDGAITRTEFRDDALRFFATLDLDGNGYIDGLELQAYERRIVPEILGRGGGPSARLAGRPRLTPAALQLGGGLSGGGLGGRGGGGESYGGQGPPTSAPKSRLTSEGAGLAQFGLLGEPEPVAAADLDFDSRITRVEFATRADQRFAHLDEAETGRLLLPDLQRRLRERSREAGRPDYRPSPSGRRDGGGGGRGGGRGGGQGGGPGGGVGGGPQI